MKTQREIQLEIENCLLREQFLMVSQRAIELEHVANATHLRSLRIELKEMITTESTAHQVEPQPASPA